MGNYYLSPLKIKKNIVFIFLLFCCIDSLIAQVVVNVPAAPGTGTSRRPYGVFFGHERTQMRYDSSEHHIDAIIGPDKFITHVGFFLSSQNNGTSAGPIVVDFNVKLYLKEVPNNTNISSSTFSSAVSGAQLCLDTLVPASTWYSAPGPPNYVVFKLTNPYLYTANGGLTSLEALVETNWATSPGGDPDGWFNPGNSDAIMFRFSNVTSRVQTWQADVTPPAGNGFVNSSRPDIQFTYINAPNCTPVPPQNTLSTASAVCGGVPFTLSLSNLPLQGGFTFQWQANTGSGWGNIPGATSSTLTTTQSVATSYQCIVQCSFAGPPITSTPVSVAMSPYLSCYCASQATIANDGDIGNVNIYPQGFPATTIINNGNPLPTFSNGTAANGYTDFTSSYICPNPLTQGVNHIASLTAITSGTTMWPNYFNVFIDYNHDGAFDPTIERVYSGGSTAQAGPYNFSGIFNVPFSSQLGITRLRVSMAENGTVNTSPCAFFGFGEVEDYHVNIVGGTPCNLSTAGNVVSNPATVCVGQTYTLSIAGNNTAGSGQTWQWQSSPTGIAGSYTNIPGATNTTYVTSQTATTYYQCVLTCPLGGTQTTDTIVVNLNPPTQCYCTPIHQASCTGTFINSVVFKNLSNLNTGCTNNNGQAYNLYPASGLTTTTVTQDSTYNISVTTSGGSQSVSLWIDYNKNGIFESSEWYMVTNFAVAGTYTIPIYIPQTSLTGLTGVRIRSRATSSTPGSNGPPDACTVFFSGETEDYFITINPYIPPACNAPVPGTIVATTTANPSGICSGVSFTLGLTGVPVFNGNYTYQWISSTTSATGPWTPIAGATQKTYTTSTNTGTWYACVMLCPAFPPGDTSSVVSVTIYPNRWVGITDDWSLPNNWCSFRTPELTDDVSISRSNPGVAAPFYCPKVAKGDSLKARNIFIDVNDTLSVFTDSVNNYNQAGSLDVNGRFITRLALPDTTTLLALGTNAGGAHPFRTAVADLRLQVIYTPTDFQDVVAKGVTHGDDVTALIFNFATLGVSNATFNGFTISIGWISSGINNFPTSDPYATPYVVFPSQTLTLTPTMNPQLVLPVSNFKWRNDSNLVIQYCFNSTLAIPGGGNYAVRLQPSPASAKMSLLLNSALASGFDGCAILFGTPGVSDNSGGQGVRVNTTFVFGKPSKKIDINIAGDIKINSGAEFSTTYSKIVVRDSVTNSGIMRLDSTDLTVNNVFINNGTFDMSWIYSGTNRRNNFYHKGATWTNNGTFTTGTSVVSFDSTLAQSINGTVEPTFYRLRLNKGGNNQLVTLNQNITVSDSLNLKTGSMELNLKTLTFNNPAVLQVRPATGGYITLNDWNSRMKWNVGTTAGLHIFPFYKLPFTGSAPAYADNYIPFEINNVAAAGDNVGVITASTYSTIANNTPYPPGVWHIHNATGANDDANMADRYWYVERSTAAPGTGNSTLAYNYLFAERSPAINALNAASQPRAQAYYTVTPAAPWGVATRWSALLPAGNYTSSFTPAPFASAKTLRTQVSGYTWPVAQGSSNPWAISTLASPLPIDLLYFDAQLKGTEADPIVKLDWATLSEKDNDYFTIERTIDFNSVLDIERVSGAGNSNVREEYTAYDYNPVFGKINYYRLKQTDFNGVSVYPYAEKWVPVRVGLKQVFDITYVSNSTQLEVMFEYDNNGPVDVLVTDMTGRIIYNQSSFGATEGLNVLPIDASLWSKGIYLITLRDKDRKVLHKLSY